MDMGKTHEQAETLADLADDVRWIRKELRGYGDQLNGGWQGREVDALNRAIDALVLRARRSSEELEDLTRDVLRAGEELEREKAEETALL